MGRKGNRMNISMKDIGYDISDMKIYEDDTMTVEIDTSDWTLEQWATILGGVPIVRCKDCKYQEVSTFFGRKSYGCELAEGYSHVCLDDDFCSRAERKTE